ncbi:amino acid adenylation domain-containing protein [Ruegeria sp. 2012CJ41-6]|uniref:Amino acid adenylation domain-containing protein n=1 Tax=Ruegeria spongiae TaxID=2942209 RepID=A0ABT0Q7K0_9RHOB|nr:amino acid adenylation domain-containing protein [Ruegeria spongiae]MCL6285133.1 amino acid adenylation domain-containing protein [Ruegeria spongiae]
MTVSPQSATVKSNSSDVLEQQQADARALLQRLAQRRIQVKLADGKLRILAPKGSVDAQLKAELAQLRDVIVKVLADGHQQNREPRRHVPFGKVSRVGEMTMSFAQQRLWFLNLLDPNSPAYVISSASRVRGEVKVDLLRESIMLLSDRHEALRMRFGERDGRPVAETLDHSPPDVDVIEEPCVPVEEREGVARKLIADQLRVAMDLANGPLVALTVISFAPNDHVLLFRVHHIVADGWSMSVLTREFMAIYECLKNGKPLALPEVVAHCVDHAAWEKRCVDSGVWDRDVAYWKSALVGSPSAVELPLDHPRPAQISYRGGRMSTEFDSETLKQVHRFCRTRGVTPFMMLIAVLQVLLYRHSGQEDVLVGSPIANRNLAEFEAMIGCVINNVVLRGDLSGNPDFSSFLQQIRNTSLKAVEHSEPPFDLVVNELNPDRSLNHAPIFQVLFTLMNFDYEDGSPEGMEIEPLPIDAGTTRFDLAVEMAEYRGVLKVSYEYSTDLFDAATIELFHRRYLSLLNSVMSEPERRLDDFSISDYETKQPVVSAQRDIEIPQDLTTPGLIVEAALANPERDAIIQGDVSLSYEQLLVRAEVLAGHLIERGVRVGDIVAVAKERGPELIVAMLAVWKVGATYLPVDPYHPSDRLAMIFEDAEPLAVLADANLSGQLPCDPSLVIVTDRIFERQPVSAAAWADVASNDLAYLIYTSGSTGKPKGVEIMHRNLVTFLKAMQQTPGFGSQDVLLSVTTPAFDIAGLEFWLPLISGGTVVVADRSETLSGKALANLIDQHQITVMQATPATWRMLIDEGWVGANRMKALCGGEAMPRSLAEALVPRVGELWNMYGPTETTIWSTHNLIRHPDQAAYIGRPIANTQAFVLDSAGNLASTGVVGELCIGGDGVARGYRNRKDLTDERFVEIKAPNGQMIRIYRTGDLVRRTHDDHLMYLGRNDFQVKVRGFRIELGEIETRLSELAEVADCAVSAINGPGEEMSLVAYVVPKGGKEFSESEAKTRLRATMPEYMVPRYFLTLDALPLTPNNKLDRNNLPLPDLSAMKQIEEADLGNVVMSPVERKVAGIWKSILQIGAVGLHSSFFDVGGHSLLLVRLHEELKKEFGEKMSVIELFQKTTVAQQSDRLGAEQLRAETSAVSRAKSRAERLKHD